MAAVRVGLPESTQSERERATLSPVSEGILARAHSADCIEYLLTLLVSYFDPEEVHDTDMEPEERFTIRTNNGELTDSEFLIIDHLAPKESPDGFIVTCTQMDDLDWGIPDMLQEAWNEYASLRPRAEWGQGFPSHGVPDSQHPARFWLKAKLTSALQQEYPFLFNQGYEMCMEPHSEGYTMVFSNGEEDPLFIGHEEVRSPSFDARSVLMAIIEDTGLEAIEVQAACGAKQR